MGHGSFLPLHRRRSPRDETRIYKCLLRQSDPPQDVEFALTSNTLDPLLPLARPFFLMVELNRTHDFHIRYGKFATQEVEINSDQMQYQPSIGSQIQAQMLSSSHLLSSGGLDDFASQLLDQWPRTFDSSLDGPFQELMSESDREDVDVPEEPITQNRGTLTSVNPNDSGCGPQTYDYASGPSFEIYQTRERRYSNEEQDTWTRQMCLTPPPLYQSSSPIPLTQESEEDSIPISVFLPDLPMQHFQAGPCQLSRYSELSPNVEFLVSSLAEEARLQTTSFQSLPRKQSTSLMQDTSVAHKGLQPPISSLAHRGRNSMGRASLRHNYNHIPPPPPFDASPVLGTCATSIFPDQPSNCLSELQRSPCFIPPTSVGHPGNFSEPGESNSPILTPASSPGPPPPVFAGIEHKGPGIPRDFFETRRSRGTACMSCHQRKVACRMELREGDEDKRCNQCKMKNKDCIPFYSQRKWHRR